MGRRVLRRHILGYSVCLCPIKGKPDLNELSSACLVVCLFVCLPQIFIRKLASVMSTRTMGIVCLFSLIARRFLEWEFHSDRAIS